MMPLFIGEEPHYIKEIAPLFYLANEKDKFLQIVYHWAGSNGLMWKNEYDDVEYLFSSITHILEDFALLDLKSEIELRKKYRIISYSGHKDYSLIDLLDWYKNLPLCTDKLTNWGMHLLSISDSAHEIGDNRMSHTITMEIFRTAVELGPKYVDALFELKNTPDDFHYWRTCLLDVYYDKISQHSMSDSDLYCLHKIVNSWINVKIEESKRNGYNSINYLHHYNSNILSQLSDEDIIEAVEKCGNCSYVEEAHYAPELQDNQYEWLINLIRSQGYNDNSKLQIQSVLSSESYRKVDLLLSIGDLISHEKTPDYVHDCVIEYILRENKYSMRDNGFNRLIEKFHIYFSQSDWSQLLLNVIAKISQTDIDSFYCVSYDLEILDLYYNLQNWKNQLVSLFKEKLDLHWSLLTACGLIERNIYTLSLDSAVNTLKDFVVKHLG